MKNTPPSSKNIIALTMERFPDGDATSNRLLALLKTFEDAGYTAKVIGNGEIRNNGNDEWLSIDKSSIKYKTIRSKSNTLLKKVFVRTFSTIILFNAFQSAKEANTSAIVTTHTTLSTGILILAKFFWKIPLIIECSEWHEKKQFSGPFSLINYLKFCYKFHILCTLSKNIICITDLLNKKFSNKCNTIIIPPTVIPSDFPYKIAFNYNSSYLKLFYGGNISGKDDIATVIKGILLLDKSEQRNILFTIAGPSPIDLENYLNKFGIKKTEYENFTKPIGRITKKETVLQLSNSDFSVLLRPISRYSMAGFPSKIVESLASGTPVITNITSDLDNYLKDGHDAIFVNECSEEEMAISLRKALHMSKDSIIEMKFNSMKTAREKFSYNNYTEKLSVFLEQIRK